MSVCKTNMENLKMNFRCRLLRSAPVLRFAPTLIRSEGGLARKSALVPLILLLILLIILFPMFPHLVLSHDNDIVWCKPIKRDEKFVIRYIHSVNKSPVEDSIRWNGKKLIICETLYQSYGAGIPNEPEDSQTFTWTDKGLLLSNINLERYSIDLFVGTIADHYLIYRDREYQLKKLAGEQILLNISVKRLSAFNLLFRKTYLSC